MINNKKGQSGGFLWRMWGLICTTLGSMFAIIFVIKPYIFDLMYMNYLKPVLENYIINQSGIPLDLQATVLQNFDRIPIYISVCLFSLLMCCIIYFFVIAFREETENVY